MSSREKRRRAGFLLLGGGIIACVFFLWGYTLGCETHQDFSVVTTSAAAQADLETGGDLTEPEPEAGGEELPLIDINHADAETLQQLPGIGPALAQAILDYREENGIFTTLEEVMEVPGIGEVTFEQIKDRIYLDYK